MGFMNKRGLPEVEVDFNRAYGETVDGVYSTVGVRFSARRFPLGLGDEAFFFSSGEFNDDGSVFGFCGVVEKLDGVNGWVGYARLFWD